MIWKKKGLWFNALEQKSWFKSHAQIPTPLIKDDVLRVYFAGRPRPDMSMTSYVDFDRNDLSKIVYVHDRPILDLGKRGMFDEHGVMPAHAIDRGNGLILLYYSGWQRAVDILYNNYTGLAVSEDGGDTFKRYFEGPILDRTTHELYSATSPYVMEHEGKWHAWYCSGTNWHEIDGKLEHTYDMKHAISDDGYVWHQPNEVAIKQKNEFEAHCMPAIIKRGDIFYMWYSYRGSKGFRQGTGDAYRLGLAKSKDLKNWERIDDKAGIELSDSGFDSEMIAYPCIFEMDGKTIMFYNGNSFGKDGFGMAILEE